MTLFLGKDSNAQHKGDEYIKKTIKIKIRGISRNRRCSFAIQCQVIQKPVSLSLHVSLRFKANSQQLA